MSDTASDPREAAEAALMEAAEAFHYDNIEGEANPMQALMDCRADRRCSFLRDAARAACEAL